MGLSVPFTFRPKFCLLPSEIGMEKKFLEMERQFRSDRKENLKGKPLFPENFLPDRTVPFIIHECASMVIV